MLKNKSLTIRVVPTGQPASSSSISSPPKILKDVPETSDFYFVHSYVICPEDNSVIKAVADYGIKVPSVVQFNNIYACQFHPEKSGKYGLKILENFCNA